MKPDIKLEWGNPKHIAMVKTHDKIMRGIKPVELKVALDYCRFVDLGSRYGAEYVRTGGVKTRMQHCVVKCPGCFTEQDIVFVNKEYSDLESCKNCDLEFDLVKVWDKDTETHKQLVFVKKEAKNG